MGRRGAASSGRGHAVPAQVPVAMENYGRLLMQELGHAQLASKKANRMVNSGGFRRRMGRTEMGFARVGETDSRSVQSKEGWGSLNGV